MPLLKCPNCGQTYNPEYILYCARCGEAVPDERGKLPKPGPLDGMGSRGGATGRKPVTAKEPTNDARLDESGQEPQKWQPPQSVIDMVLEYRNQLNETPDDHSTRYALGLAYFLARQWSKAEAELTTVTEALPDYEEAFARLAICRARLGDLQGALAAAQRAYALAPDRAEYARLVERLQKEGA